MKPYYYDDLVTLYNDDWRALCQVGGDPNCYAAAVTDPPYGINYRSNARRVDIARSIRGDESTEQRDQFLEYWQERPALVFGTWRVPRPATTRQVLIWDTKGALGMGAMDLPWKPSHQEIYVIGKGFAGRRDSDVITCAPVQAMARNGRTHPHEKPVDLMVRLIDKCPAGRIFDPFAGTGSTLVAAKRLGRHVVGIEIEERYCEIAAQRLAQDVLDFGGAA